LAKYFEDKMDDIALSKSKIAVAAKPLKPKPKALRLDIDLVERCHKAMPKNIKKYLNSRGIPDELINKHKLGWGMFYGKWWITIPVQNKEGDFFFLNCEEIRQMKIIRINSNSTPPVAHQLFTVGRC